MSPYPTRIVMLLAIEAVALVGLAGLGLDIRAHRRVEELGGVNVWGYRGAVARHRQPNEIRVVIVGGTRAYGWGEPASALASQLRRVIMLSTDRPGQPLRPVVVVNLGRLGALPDVYPETMARYAYLQPDYVCLYDDLGARGAGFNDHPSGVFAATGYSPALPLVLREKGMAWQHGAVAAGYGGGTGAAQPFVRRVAGRALESAGLTLDALDGAAAAVVPHRRTSEIGGESEYGDALLRAVDAAHALSRGVVVVLSPAETAQQVANRAAVLGRLAERRRANTWLRLVDLGDHPELTGSDMRVDGWNYGSAGLTRIAETIAPAVVSLVQGS